MKCYCVLVHGRLDWSTPSSAADDDGETLHQRAGFYCHRYVLASTIHNAQEAAFRRVRENLDRQTGWIKARAVELELEAEETSPPPIYQLLKPDNPGHTFYLRE
jgi:hypothetical protein